MLLFTKPAIREAAHYLLKTKGYRIIL
jgi:hypothetical protein